MAEIVSLSADARQRAGKGAARAIRREGRVPGVIYGDKQDPQLISMDYKDAWKHIRTGRFLSTLVDIDVDGDKTRAIARDIQFDPVRDFVMHVDFLRLGRGARVTVDVRVDFINQDDCPGIARGGVLNVVRYEVSLSCLATAIPESIEVDLAGLDIGDGAHISDVTLPEGAESTISDRDFTICTIAAPAGLTEAEEEGEEDEEGVEAGEVPTVGDEEETGEGDSED